MSDENIKPRFDGAMCLTVSCVGIIKQTDESPDVAMVFWNLCSQ